MWGSRHMKCYLTLTAPARDDDPYVDLLEVALKSARENTTLDVHVLYDGPEYCRTFRLMKQYGAKVIPHRFFAALAARQSHAAHSAAFMPPQAV